MKTKLTSGRTNAEAQRCAEQGMIFFRRVFPRPLRLHVSLPLMVLLLGVLALIPVVGRAATNNLTALLQQGLFEEQANRNLDAAIANYSLLAAQFDQDRQLAATAVFRLGECYRAQGKTNEAAAQYQRILKDFSDQKTLATLSRQDLTGMGMTQSDSGKLIEHPGEAAAAGSLASQISGIEKLESDPEELALAVIAIFPDDVLKNMMTQLAKLQQQVERVKANPQLTVRDLIVRDEDYSVVSFDGKLIRATLFSSGTNLDLLANFQRESGTQLAWIKQRVNFILGIQKARLKVLLAADGSEATTGVSPGKLNSATTDDEDREIQRIQQMIQNSPDLINASGEGGNTPLTQAAYKGWLKVAAYLIYNGADVNGSGIAPLNAAAASGNRAMVELLLSRGANVNSKDSQGKTPLNIAAEKKFQAVVEVLLANKADVNAQDNFGNTPLASAAINRQVKTIQSLLTAGANPNLENKNGRTPFSVAAASGSPEIVKLFLAAKADPNGGKLDAPLLAAIQARDVGSAELLLQAGANPNAKEAMARDVSINGSTHWAAGHPSVTPLFLAVSMNQLPMVQLLLKFKTNPDDSQTDGRAVIFNALDKPDVLTALLNAGAKAEVQDQTDNPAIPGGPGTFQGRLQRLVNPDLKRTPLLYAAGGESNVVAVSELLQHGANPNASDGRGNTALHYAAMWLADEQVFALLLNAKANPNVRNNDGQTPLDLVKERLRIQVSGSRFPNQDQSGINYGQLSAEQKDQAEKLIALLHQHGALDNLPDWNRITVSRPAANFSTAVFQRGTNDWNHFTLLELVVRAYGNNNGMRLSFPDLTRVVVARPGTNNAAGKRMEINLLTATNSIDYAKDMPLEFGDVVEIPERGHTLAEQDNWFNGEREKLRWHIRGQAGEVRLAVAGGQTVQVPLKDFEVADGYLGNVLDSPAARNVLTSSSDLARVKVTRRDLKTGNSKEWILDGSNQNNQGTPALLLRDGDVIEVPEKP